MKKVVKSEMLTAKVEPDQLAALTELADSQDITRSALVRQLVEAALTKNATTTTNRRSADA